MAESIDVVTVEQKEIKLSDLDDDLMASWLNVLSITEQTAVVRVCNRFDEAAYKSTTFMDVKDIPHDFQIKIIPRLTKLRKISCFQFLLRNDQIFLETLALYNPNVERIIGLGSDSIRIYIAKSLLLHGHIKYRGLITEDVYESLVDEFPGIKVRYFRPKFGSTPVHFIRVGLGRVRSLHYN